MSDPLPPSKRELAAQYGRELGALRDNGAAAIAAADIALSECARLRAALGEVCGAAMVLRAGMLPCDHWTDEQHEAVETIDRAVKSARSTP